MGCAPSTKKGAVTEPASAEPASRATDEVELGWVEPLKGEVLQLWDESRDLREPWKGYLDNPPTFEPQARDKAEVATVLVGDVTRKRPVTSSVIRPFISSTFTDTSHERDLLISDVYPYLTSYARRLGLEFNQPSEMRWGIRAETSAAHQTSAICMEEIRRCQDESSGISYVVLLGDKYGFRPFPAEISSDVMVRLLPAIESLHGADALAVANEWYLEDTNASRYILQPSSLTTSAKWWGGDDDEGIFNRLQRYLRTASSQVLDEDIAKFYTISVTEDEVEKGLIAEDDRESNVFAFRRILKDVDQHTQYKKTGLFVDRLPTGHADSEAQQKLKELRDKRLFQLLPRERIKSYELEWGPGINGEKHGDYLKQFCDDFTDVFIATMNRAAQRLSTVPDPIFEEAAVHLDFASSRASSYTVTSSNDPAIDAVNGYLQEGSDAPFTIVGKSGSGKTSLVAYTFVELVKRVKPAVSGPVCIIRFLGTTGPSTAIRPLLYTLCAQLARAYGADLTPPTDYQGLLKKFGSEYLSLATADRPLYLFLDSLDQLNDENSGPLLDWLPPHLPPHVHFVVSTLPDVGPCYSQLKGKLMKRMSEAQVTAMVPGDGSQLLDNWLQGDKRSLTEGQRKLILDAFVGCPSPLFLKIAYESSLEWRSYDKIESLKIGANIKELVIDLFHRLHTEHGRVLTSAALGLITAAKNGLTSNELIDILSCDEEVLNDVFEWWTPPVRRLPPLLWTRLQSDLDHYLIRRGADGGALVWNWYHRQFWETADEFYLGDSEVRNKRLGHIYDYFTEKWAHTPKPYKDKQGNEILASRQVQAQPLLNPSHAEPYNLRRLSETPHALMAMGRWQEADDLCSDLEFLGAMVGADRLFDAIGLLHRIIRTPPEVHTASPMVMNASLMLQTKNNVLVPYPELLLQVAAYQSPSAPIRQAALDYLAAHPEIPYLDWSHGQPEGRPSCVMSMAGHEDLVTRVVVSPDHQYLASVSVDRTLKLWDITTGAMVYSTVCFEGKDDEGSGACYNSDGSVIYVSSRSGQVQAHASSTGLLMTSCNLLPPDTDVSGSREIRSIYLAYHHKCNVLIASGEMGRVHVLDAVTLQTLQQGGSPGEDISYLTVSDCSTYLATGHRQGRLKLYTLGSDSSSLIPTEFTQGQHDNHIDRYVVYSMRFSHHSKYLVSGPQSLGTWGDGEALFVWSVPDMSIVARVPHDVNFCGTRGIDFMPDDSAFYFACQYSSIKECRTGDWSLGKRFSDKVYIGNSLHILPNGYIATSAENEITIVDTGAPGEAQGGGVVSGTAGKAIGTQCYITRDEKYLASAEGSNYNGPSNFYSMAAFDEGRAEVAFTAPAANMLGNTLATSPDGTLFTGSTNGLVRIWDMKSGKDMQSNEITAHVRALTPLPDNKTFVACTPEKLYHVQVNEARDAIVLPCQVDVADTWDVQTFIPCYSMPTDFQPEVARIAHGGTKKEITIHDSATLVTKYTLENAGTFSERQGRFLGLYWSESLSLAIFANENDEVLVFSSPGPGQQLQRTFTLVQLSNDDDVVRILLHPEKQRIAIITKFCVGLVYQLPDIAAAASRGDSDPSLAPSHVLLMPGDTIKDAAVDSTGTRVFTRESVGVNPWQWPLYAGKGQNGFNAWSAKQ